MNSRNLSRDEYHRVTKYRRRYLDQNGQVQRSHQQSTIFNSVQCATQNVLVVNLIICNGVQLGLVNLHPNFYFYFNIWKKKNVFSELCEMVGLLI